MRQFVIVSLVILFFSSSFCMASVIEARSQIRQVTLYPNGARVVRETPVSVVSGNQVVGFRNIPSPVDANNLSVSGKGSFRIVSVSSRNVEGNELIKTPAYLLITDSVNIVSLRIAELKNDLNVIDNEQQILLANKKVAGENSNLNIVELRNALDFFKTRLTDLNTRKLSVSEKLKKEEVQLTRLKEQQQQELNRNLQLAGEVEITLAADKPGSGTLELSYFVANAGWNPDYDLRVDDLDKPVSLTLKGQIWQNSGEYWNKVSLTLSSANPMLSNNKPELYPWYLDIQQPPRPLRRESMAMKKGMADMAAPEAVMEEEIGFAPAMMAGTVENRTSVDYVISEDWSLEPTGKIGSVVLDQISLPATYTYYTAPKLDKSVFLIARVTGWETVNLPAASMNLYLDGNFVGQSYLNTAQTADTLPISLGRDKNICVERIRNKFEGERSGLGSSVKQNRSYTLTVRNKKKQPIDLIIEDQIPLSANPNITTELISSDGAGFQSDKGLLIWKLNIKPATQQAVTFEYEVKYPKNNRPYID